MTSSTPFWQQFWPNLVATLIGAFVGLLAALRVDHRRERRARAAQESALVSAARDAVQANLPLCAQLKPILQGPGRKWKLPTFTLDPGLLDVILPRLAEVSEDTRLLEALNTFRYQLHHANRKLDHMMGLSRTPQDGVGELLENLADSITATVEVLEKLGQQTLPPLLEARLPHPEMRGRPVVPR